MRLDLPPCMAGFSRWHIHRVWQKCPLRSSTQTILCGRCGTRDGTTTNSHADDRLKVEIRSYTIAKGISSQRGCQHMCICAMCGCASLFLHTTITNVSQSVQSPHTRTSRHQHAHVRRHCRRCRADTIPTHRSVRPSDPRSSVSPRQRHPV